MELKGTTLRLPKQAVDNITAPETAPAPLISPEELVPTLPIQDSVVVNSSTQSSDSVDTRTFPTSDTEYPAYEAGRLTQFYTHDGSTVKPVNGIYTADTEEKFKLLNYYASQDAGLVTPLS